MKEKELKLLTGLVEYHRTILRYWNNKDEIEHDRIEPHEHFLELDEWLKVRGHIEKEDDLLIILSNLDN
tara:strand:+ start:179 stop:385 length:207 start_codon:yes stop_codon:yes gene_type:complete